MRTSQAGVEPTVVDELVRWFCFTVALGLLPLAIHFLYLRAQPTRHTSVWQTLRSTLGGGELLLINCCIAGSAIGERVGRRAVRPRIELPFCVWCLFDIAGSVHYYTLAVSRVAHDTGAVATLSLAFFILTVLPSAALMLITFKRR